MSLKEPITGRFIIPSGKTHNIINLSAGALLIVPGMILNPMQVENYCVAGGIALSTFLLSPDLDMDGTEPDKGWGILEKIWNPYSKLFRHRGISHMPIIGTLTRLVYLAVVPFIFSVILGNLDRWGFVQSRYFWWIVAGIVTGDNLHILSDEIYSRFLKITDKRKWERKASGYYRWEIKKPSD